ncbi:Holliday junction resolvase RecU [Ureaplasma canigenitalium]|uniref:Holliday junction resolvase RecU n=1 Tax=Ureaplasma canigenitalium TaxID=42092 RepID=UPI0004E2756F|nr:Holliday junction resolvase RecU [Ureaplasma canigenitalium]
MFYINKGMHFETLINQSIEYFNIRYQAFFIKRNVDIKIRKVVDKSVDGRITRTSQTDYYGFFNGMYFDFEAKQTNGDVFDLSMIKKHQLNHLALIDANRGYSFVLVAYVNHDLYFLITYQELINYIRATKSKHLDIDYVKEHFFQIPLTLPGVIDFNQVINYLQKNTRFP